MSVHKHAKDVHPGQPLSVALIADHSLSSVTSVTVMPISGKCFTTGTRFGMGFFSHCPPQHVLWRGFLLSVVSSQTLTLVHCNYLFIIERCLWGPRVHKVYGLTVNMYVSHNVLFSFIQARLAPLERPVTICSCPEKPSLITGKPIVVVTMDGKWNF